MNTTITGKKYFSKICSYKQNFDNSPSSYIKFLKLGIIHSFTYLFVYIYLGMCVCLFICIWTLTFIYIFI